MFTSCFAKCNIVQNDFEIHSNKLILRNVNPLDSEGLVMLANDRSIADMMNGSIPFPYPSDVADKWIEKHHQDNLNSQAMSWIITYKDKKALIGSIQLRLDESRKSARFSYWLGKPYWNQGITTEAARSVLKFGFEQLGLDKIEAEVFQRNPASRAVLLKLGFIFQESTIKEEKLDHRIEVFELYSLESQAYFMQERCF